MKIPIGKFSEILKKKMAKKTLNRPEIAPGVSGSTYQSSPTILLYSPELLASFQTLFPRNPTTNTPPQRSPVLHPSLPLRVSWRSHNALSLVGTNVLPVRSSWGSIAADSADGRSGARRRRSGGGAPRRSPPGPRPAAAAATGSSGILA